MSKPGINILTFTQFFCFVPPLLCVIWDTAIMFVVYLVSVPRICMPSACMSSICGAVFFVPAVCMPSADLPGMLRSI